MKCYHTPYHVSPPWRKRWKTWAAKEQKKPFAHNCIQPVPKTWHYGEMWCECIWDTLGHILNPPPSSHSPNSSYASSSCKEGTANATRCCAASFEVAKFESLPANSKEICKWHRKQNKPKPGRKAKSESKTANDACQDQDQKVDYGHCEHSQWHVWVGWTVCGHIRALK